MIETARRQPKMFSLSASSLFVHSWSQFTRRTSGMNGISSFCSVSTSYGQNLLKRAQRRIEFQPSKNPEIDLGLTPCVARSG